VNLDALVGPRCPSYDKLGRCDQSTDMYVCGGDGRHHFWVATRHCGCGDVPVCLEGSGVWVCVNCGQWEAVQS
jgi:hypothetical protein